MNNPTHSHTGPTQDVKSIISGIFVALVIGAIVVVTIIWPAEYGKDPTGVGGLLGLMVLSDAGAPAASKPEKKAEGVELVDHSVSSSTTPKKGAEAEKIVEVPPIPMEAMEQAGADKTQLRETPYRNHKVEVTLQSREAVEYKVELAEGEPLLYSWSAEGGDIYTDLHAEPFDKSSYPESYWLRYVESENMGDQGFFVAKFTGKHGWYWLNRTANPITVSLEVSGHYTSLKKIPKATQ
jgi:hypothetical protein